MRTTRDVASAWPAVKVAACLAAVGLAAACGEGRVAGGGPLRVAVATSPARATLRPLESRQFAATVVGAADPSVVWSVAEPGGGTVSASGLYTAPSVPGTFHLWATSAADATRSASSTVTVMPSPVAISGSSIGVERAAPIAGTWKADVGWRTAPEGCGAITGTCRVVVPPVVDPASGRAAVVVSLPVVVSVSPASVSLEAGSAQQFAARVIGTLEARVIWSVEPAACGAISDAGLFAAGAGAATCRVSATSVQDSTATGSAEVTVRPPIAISVSPAAVSLEAGSAQRFTATVTGTSNPAVAWSVAEAEGGRVDDTGLYLPPAIAGTFHVVATAIADPGKSASAAVTVAVPVASAMVHLEGRPAFASEGNAALLTDGAYRWPNAWTFTPSRCSAASPCWGAVQVGAGPARLLVDWSFQDGGGNFDSRIASAETISDYALQVSANSTDGSDGDWAPAIDALRGGAVAVAANPYVQRSHLIDFAGYSWVRLAIAGSTADEVDELDLWDATADSADSYFFHGDSITVRCALRGTNANYGEQPSFAADLHAADARRFPLQVDGGIVGRGAARAALEIGDYLPLFPHLKYWLLTMGTNDLCAGADAFAASAQAWIDAVKASGAVPVLVHPPWANDSAAYCSANGPAFNAAVDALVASNGLHPAVRLYEATAGHPEYFETGGVHPNHAGCAAWNRTLASAAARSFAACVAPWNPTWAQAGQAGSWWAEFTVVGGSLARSVSLEVLGGATYPLTYGSGKWSGGVGGVNAGTSVVLNATDATGATARTLPFRYLVDLTPQTDPCGGTAGANPACVPLKRGMVSFTFDDAYASQFSLGRPVLAARGVKATFYDVSSYIQDGYAGYQTIAEATALAADGHEIADHTATHASLPGLTAEEIDSELSDSQAWLEANVGAPVLSLASPYGAYDDTVKAEARKYFTSHRTVNAGINYLGQDLYELHADGVSSVTSVATACGWLQEAAATGGWRILFFHDLTSAASSASSNTYPVADLDAILACAQATPGLDIVTVAQGVARLACAAP